MSDPPSSLLPTLTFLLGFGAKYVTDLLQDQRLSRREREARKDARQDFLQQRKSDFQRQNLLKLQEASMKLVRSGARQHLADEKAFKMTGKWQGHLLPEDVSDEGYLAQRATTILMVRISDPEIRRLVHELKGSCECLGRVADLKEGNLVLASAGSIHDSLNQRIGEVLRNLDEEDTAAAQPGSDETT